MHVCRHPGAQKFFDDVAPPCMVVDAYSLAQHIAGSAMDGQDEPFYSIVGMLFLVVGVIGWAMFLASITPA